MTVGDALGPATIDDVSERLRRSGRFHRVQVLKRYRSIDATDDVVLVVIVEERAGIGIDLPRPGRLLRRATGRALFLPILDYDDGYGFTYGVRASYVGLFGPRSRLSFPLTWGGSKQVAAQVDKRPAFGPVSRLEGSASLWRRRNPHYRIEDTRRELRVRGERALAGALRVGVSGAWTGVSFADLDDTFSAIGADVTLDTRHDPDLPRNAVFARAGWESLRFGSGAVNRYQMDLRGYVPFIGPSVVAVRLLRAGADAPLPPYERYLVGGAASLRGHRAGFGSGDNLAAASVELRVPITSPVDVGRMGLSFFVDTAAAYDRGVRLREVSFRQGIGGGVFITVAVFKLNLDVARGLGAETRVHVSSGFSF